MTSRRGVPADQRQISVRIDSDRAILDARQQGRQVCARAGLSASEVTIVATMISELARNILQYAGDGHFSGLRSQKNSGASFRAAAG